MKSLLFKRITVNALMIMCACLAAQSQDSPRRSSSTIIFSSPKSDSVSSNLNQLNSKESPFKDMESDLKKPFEIFNPHTPSPKIRPPDARFTQPQQQNTKSLKEQLDKRAEEMFLSPELFDPESGGDDLFRSSEDSVNPYTRKPKTQLDRYYDRVDRVRVSATNRTSTTDIFGEKKDFQDKDIFGFDSNPSDDPFNNKRDRLGRSSKQMTNNITENGGFFSEKPRSKSFGDTFDSDNGVFSTRSDMKKDTRLDNFKQLLDRPGYTPASQNNINTPQPILGSTAPRSTYGAASPSSPSLPSSTRHTSLPQQSFSTTAGLVGDPGRPQGLADLATTPSAYAPPKPVESLKAPPAVYTVPKRKF